MKNGDHMEIIKYRVNDIIELKKPHPCGGKQFRVMRVGSSVRVICLGCGRDMDMDRIKLEKSTKRIVSSEYMEGEGNES